ncbi:MAG: Rne/Rng family ribonuclease [Saprospiraceae bacterium]
MNNKELIINTTPTEVEIALLEDGRLAEMHHQKTNNNFTVGDIFLGRVKKLMPSLNAAFIDIGHKKDAFLHYTDLGPPLRSLLKYSNNILNGTQNSHLLDNFKEEPEILKTGKIDQVLTKGQLVLVQILKEPISTKGPRLSCEVTIPGRYLILAPFSDRVSVSKKISSADERKRLQLLGESIRPKGFGLIIRTVAEGKKVAELHEEMIDMMEQWHSIFKQMKTGAAPIKLLSELDKTSSILRDLLTDSFNRIVVNDKEFYNSIKSYLQNIAPDKLDILTLHKGTRTIFDHYGVTRQIKASFGKTATLNSGAYVIIENTEAMHVIDVNSGHKVTSGNTDDSIYSVNVEAAEEIARQLRLRDIGGLIVIDFIDMKNNNHRQALQQAITEFMSKDRAQHTILPLSKFGLMQITRQRVRPEIIVNTAEVCPTCNGNGIVQPSSLLIDDIERDLEFLMVNNAKVKLRLKVHPFIFAFLKRGLISRQVKWYLKYYRWIAIHEEGSYFLNEYRFFDENDDEIRLT